MTPDQLATAARAIVAELTDDPVAVSAETEADGVSLRYVLGDRWMTYAVSPKSWERMQPGACEAELTLAARQAVQQLNAAPPFYNDLQAAAERILVELDRARETGERREMWAAMDALADLMANLGHRYCRECGGSIVGTGPAHRDGCTRQDLRMHREDALRALYPSMHPRDESSPVQDIPWIESNSAVGHRIGPSQPILGSCPRCGGDTSHSPSCPLVVLRLHGGDNQPIPRFCQRCAGVASHVLGCPLDQVPPVADQEWRARNPAPVEDLDQRSRRRSLMPFITNMPELTAPAAGFCDHCAGTGQHEHGCQGAACRYCGVADGSDHRPDCALTVIADEPPMHAPGRSRWGAAWRDFWTRWQP